MQLKTTTSRISVLLVVLIGHTGSGASQEISSPDYEAVKQTIEQSIGWAIEKDFEAMYRLWDDCGSFKGIENCLEDVFQTGVLEKKDGRWVHVLMHGSYPVDRIPESYARRFYSDFFEKQ